MFKNFNPLDFLSSNIDFYIYNTRPYWQKYVNNVNMTQIECNLEVDNNCFISKYNNTLYTATEKENVSIQYLHHDLYLFLKINFFCNSIFRYIIVIYLKMFHI